MALSDLPLLQSSDLTLLGSFQLDDQVNGYFSFGGGGLSFDPTGNGGAGSLYVAGFSPGITFGQISIPSLGGLASVLTIPTMPPNRGVLDTVGGSLIYNNRLVLSMFLFYDASANVATNSHWYGSDKTVANLGSPVKVGTLNPGYYGYMAHVPASLQSLFGGPCVVGQCGISIADRTSWGPSLFCFDPDDIGVLTPVPATPLVYYNEAHPLHNHLVQNVIYNHTAAVSGVFFPPGTRSVIFLGRIGAGPVCYGSAECGDPTNQQQVGESAVPFGGACYDPATRKIYFGRGSITDNTWGGNPTVYVWQHTAFDPEPPAGGAGGPIVPRIVPFL